ncbi:uncharacterized protein CLV92_107128 [Kineococcus xinjiangensis]|uniref:DUF418 domain-containing protein n=1 Tax=Kineococcus xinjiangensis TaxID=512762 RepID=A0A2S6IKB9_9ACTN|nr:DUF418 domain-containing protein [Kineococcus xinjiangensis]PPK94625.1 uncharacterized protein CLV92_107128 [Kineococcus xinjiangensis]
MTRARLDGLDVARGIAILGTFATNVWIFTAPAGLLGVLDGDTPASSAALLLQQLPNGKFLGMLTLLFGMGLALQQAAAARRGDPWPGRYPWRALLLLLDGTLHYFLVAEFDVLMGYAVTGLLVAFLLARSLRVQRAWLVTAATCHVALMSLLVLAVALVPDEPGGEGDDEGTAAAARVLQHGSWWDLVQWRWENIVLFRLEPVLIGALGVALFLLGARLLRAGVATADGTRLRRRLLLVGALALPLDLLLGTAGGDAGVIAARYLTAPLVALGLLAAVLGACLRIPRTPLGAFARRRLAEVGRTALSCYVLQNLLASALCYGWGLGLTARLDGGTRTAATVLILLGVSAAVVTAAALWLRVFQRGPLEALLHQALRWAPGARPRTPVAPQQVEPPARPLSPQ